MWVIAGSPPWSNDVWYSTDGVNWTAATLAGDFPARHDHTSVVYDNKMWVIAGEKGPQNSDKLNDVWWSN